MCVILSIRDRITEVEIGFIRNGGDRQTPAYNRNQAISNSSLNSSLSMVAGTYLVNEGRLIQSNQPYDSSVASSRASFFSSPTRNSLLNSRDLDSRNTNIQSDIESSPQPEPTPSPTLPPSRSPPSRSPPSRYNTDNVSSIRSKEFVKIEKPNRFPSPSSIDLKSQQDRQV